MPESEPVRGQQAALREAEPRLLRGLRERSPEACKRLCEQFGPRIHRFAAARLLGDGQSAEDVMVQALADATRNIGRFNPRKSTFSAWLYGIVRRKIQGEKRQQSRLKSVPTSAQVPMEGVAELSQGQDMAAGLVARLEAQRQVAVLASVLSDLEMEVLVLHCVDELSAREVGQIVGRSERAIHSILHRARRKARERLASDGD